MRTEVLSQPSELQKIVLPSIERNRFGLPAIFTGSGDSYVAGMVAQHLSNYRSLCITPQEIILNPKLLQNRQLYIVSISGKTKSNLRVLDIAKKIGSSPVAITANAKSQLALECNNVIELRYKKTGILTAGTISFTASMLACASLVTSFTQFQWDRIYSDMTTIVEQISDRFFGGRDPIYFLGNGSLFCAASYASLKANEIFGMKGLPHSLDEFFHAPLFGVNKKNDRLVIYGHSNDNRGGDKLLCNILTRNEFCNFYVSCGTDSALESICKAVAFSQLFMLKKAEVLNIQECYFLRNKQLLELSSDSIY